MLAAVEIKVMLVLVPLQMLSVFLVVIVGIGLTVKVIIDDEPTQEPTVEVGITIYSTVPADELLGLFSVWTIVFPEPRIGVVILPVIFPIVHAKLLRTLPVKLIAVGTPLHTFTVREFVTTGEGFTVTVIVKDVPAHAPVEAVGVTIY